MEREPFISEDLTYMLLQQWQTFDRNLIAGMTTRQDGVSAPPFQSLNMALHVGDDSRQVIANRKRLAGKLNVPLNNWVSAEQVHGSAIRKVEDEDRGKGTTTLQDAIPETDGLYTRQRNLLLTMLFADCVPLYFYAPAEGIVGLAHAGWRGTTANIAGKMVEKWTELEGVPPHHIFATIGPSIGKCCYEVDRRVINEVNQVLETEDSRPYQQIDKNHFQLDLRRLNHQLLIKAGVLDQQIARTSYCTSCHNDLFFSHRKENGKTGRIMSFILLS